MIDSAHSKLPLGAEVSDELIDFYDFGEEGEERELEDGTLVVTRTRTLPVRL